MTTIKDLLRDFGREVRNQGFNDYSMSDQDLEDKIEEYIEQIKERLIG